MARSRRQTQEVVKVASAGITELDQSAIDELLAGRSSRGEYNVQMSQFLDAGAAGWQIDLTEGVFKGKKASTVKAGFENTKSGKNAVEGAENVRVIQDGTNVFLVRKDA